ncbi:hypothetical protein Plav_0387 [Parvibaculum lavamentivorans DS-1]|uniref:Beta protein n=1 Tax=Parvibaculum lavamentivorans (strain DS-1 / DSM 13023 / NCIMB 13966) TaxID=402881 RepID=A7HQ27_PARL1|nr:beta family protein [Parvibaculum lavamentivorans]ABS62010.1 hypothetical protein Plav_0387 [Parvibaculum lavamentivorans DS-1]
MFTYYPSVRFKQGERYALYRMPQDMKRHVEPRLIAPPIKEYDPELGRIPTLDEVIYLTGERIGKHWPIGRAFLDLSFIADEVGEVGIKRILELAQIRNQEIVPVATLRDLQNPSLRDVRGKGKIKLAVLVGYEEVEVESVRNALKEAGLDASDCVIFLDFKGAPLKPEIAAGAVASIFDTANEIGRWQRIVFQASNFPSKNPAGHGESVLIPRDEWSAFHAAMLECGVAPERVGYGDFAADSSEIKFPKKKKKGGGGRAIRHLRYATATHWFVVRAQSEGCDADLMRDVCQRISNSVHYEGRSFSYADNRIFLVGQAKVGPGTASMWREWNTLHHITRVVRDLGAMAGVQFADRPVIEEPEQQLLFPLNA